MSSLTYEVKAWPGGGQTGKYHMGQSILKWEFFPKINFGINYN